jgi:DNA-binding HxlR family transcriptional regulator
MNKMERCPVLTTVAVIGGKWRARILWCLRENRMGFGDLHRNVRISEKVLTENLKALEADGIIFRMEEDEGRVRKVYYAYTPFGRSLIPVLDVLGAWGVARGAAIEVR